MQMATDSSTALITGGTSGIGRAAANKLSQLGIHVVVVRSEEHTSELQSQSNLVCRLLLEKKKQQKCEVIWPTKSRTPHRCTRVRPSLDATTECSLPSRPCSGVRLYEPPSLSPLSWQPNNT